MDKEIVLDKMNATNKNTMMEPLGVVYTDYTGDTITAEMPVNHKVHQPYGILHGGASATLAETVGSILSAMQVDRETQGAVGVNLNIYHLNSVRDGKIIAHASFARKGKDLHVIDIDITDENGKIISKAILTTKVITLRKI